MPWKRLFDRNTDLSFKSVLSTPEPQMYESCVCPGTELEPAQGSFTEPGLPSFAHRPSPKFPRCGMGPLWAEFAPQTVRLGYQDRYEVAGVLGLVLGKSREVRTPGCAVSHPRPSATPRLRWLSLHLAARSLEFVIEIIPALQESAKVWGDRRGETQPPRSHVLFGYLRQTNRQSLLEHKHRDPCR